MPTAKFLNKTNELHLFDNPSSRSIEVIADEPMLFSASFRYAFDNGGPLTREVLSALLNEHPIKLQIDDPAYPYFVVDTRVHMLMPNMYPAIPGWHCDHTPRGENGQPDLTKASVRQNNLTVILSTVSGLCETAFLHNGLTYLDYDPTRVWGSINDTIENDKSFHGYGSKNLREGVLTEFSGQTLHTATKSMKRGWRYFFRGSFMDEAPKNRIRRQVQVYTDSSVGW